MKKEFKHSQAERHETVNVVARVRCGQISGWGEGVPRLYVTGESAEEAVAFAGQLAGEVSGRLRESDLESLPSAVAFVREWVVPPEDDGTRNAARAAVELAILDAACRRCREPLWRVAEHVVGPEMLRDVRSVRYSVVLSSDDLGTLKKKAFLYRLYGLRSVKLKVGAGGDDVTRVATTRAAIGRRADLRLDANNAWSLAQATEVLSAAKAYRFSAVEEPLTREEGGGLRELRERLGVSVILDESFKTIADADRAKREGLGDILNVRIAKCGGFVRSLECIERARALGLGYQLGCMVGESSILSAAGRHLAQRVRDITYLEGSYDRHLLRDNVVRRDLTFGWGGKAAALQGFGLGIDVDEDMVRQLAV